MGATVAETWQAHDAVMHARTEEWGTVGTAMAIRGVEASSSATFATGTDGIARVRHR